MNAFNYKRFRTVFVHDLVSNYRSILATLIGMTLGFFAAETGSLMSSVYHIPTTTLHLQTTSSTMLFIALFFLFFGITVGFHNLDTKQARISLFMLPATNLEKFLSRIAIGILLSTVGIALSLVVSDLLRQLFFLITGGETASLLPYYCDWLFGHDSYIVDVTGNTPRGVLLSLSFIVGIICRYAYYLLCAVMFRKRAFLKGFGLEVMLLFIGGSLSATYILRHMMYWDDNELSHAYDLNVTTVTITILLALLTVVFTGLAYYLFTHKQVIPRRKFRLAWPF